MDKDGARRVSAVHLIVLVCVAQALVQIGAFFWPALLPGMITRWSLTNSDAGWITAIFYGAYILAVPILVTLTDRIDAKRVYLAGVAMTVLGHLFFAFFADGLWTALVARSRRDRMGWHLHDRSQASRRQDRRETGVARGCRTRCERAARAGWRSRRKGDLGGASKPTSKTSPGERHSSSALLGWRSWLERTSLGPQAPLQNLRRFSGMRLKDQKNRTRIGPHLGRPRAVREGVCWSSYPIQLRCPRRPAGAQ